MSIIAVLVFVVAYALIATERIHKTAVALAGAAIMVALPVINSDDVFYSHDTGIDWDVIFLLLGMMIIVSVLRQTGVFEYTAIFWGFALDWLVFTIRPDPWVAIGGAIVIAGGVYVALSERRNAGALRAAAEAH